MELFKLKDVHKNEPCFIYGAGPSIRFVDENKLINYIGIAVNSGILKAQKCKKLYFVSDDVGCYYWSYFDLLYELENCKVLLYKDKFEKIFDKIKELDVYKFSHTWWFDPVNKKYNLPDGLRLNKTGPIIGARNSTASAVHIAYILGCNPIILLGIDNSLSNDKYRYRYFWQHWPISKQPKRIFGAQFNTKTQNFGFDSSAFINYWKKFCEVNKDILENELEIIDCSDSPFNLFKKMSIKEVMEKYDEKSI